MQRACIVLHLGGKAEALSHPLTAALVARDFQVACPDLRATGAARPAQDSIAGAPDHNSAEHALWIGRPLLGQWVFDVGCLLDWLAQQPTLDRSRLAVAGLGQAGIVALCTAALFEDRVASVAALAMPVTYVTERAYPQGSSMGVLTPGILRLADIAHLAALAAPRNLHLADGVSVEGQTLADNQLQEAYEFTRAIYYVYKSNDKLSVTKAIRMDELAAKL
jgi:pimeloyl-ACP methyl ester carboxylesterase